MYLRELNLFWELQKLHESENKTLSSLFLDEMV